jgi:hypothetical protein
MGQVCCTNTVNYDRTQSKAIYRLQSRVLLGAGMTPVTYLQRSGEHEQAAGPTRFVAVSMEGGVYV